MSARFDPSEEQIAELLKRFSPRQLAIGYLRAQRRARSAKAAFDVLGSVSELQRAAFSGDMDGAHSAVDAAKRRMRLHEEASK